MVPALTNYEMKLVIDREVLLTKNRIIQKVYELFGSLSEDYKSRFNIESLFTENETDSKISRGENYKGLPYVILDYPRNFARVDVFAIRTFFWWGNFFSITLQLGGKYQQKYFAAIQKVINQNKFEGWSIGCAANAWEHHFENDNYLPIQKEKDYRLSTLPYVKIAKKIPLVKWDEVELFLIENFTFLIKVLYS